MPTTDEELAAKRERVEKLREQVASAEASRLEREATLSNEITAVQLDAEEARLEAQLSQAKEAAKATNVKEGAALPLEQAKEQMRAAQALQKAATSTATTTEKKED